MCHTATHRAAPLFRTAPHHSFGQNLYLGPLVTEEELEAARGGGGEGKKVAAEAKEGADKDDQDQAAGKAGGDENDDGGSAGGGEGGDGGSVDRTAVALEHLSATGR